MFIIHINKTHIYIFNEVFITIFYFFVLSVDVNAADDKSKEMELPETFISGDASVGAQLVDSCAACHGVDGNSISTIGLSFQDKIKISL